MGEVEWKAGAIEIDFSTTKWLAMLFMPLWSHDCWQIRLNLKHMCYWSRTSVSIQNVTPAKLPTGVPLAELKFSTTEFAALNVMYTFQKRFPSIRLVKSVTYALVIKLESLLPAPSNYTSYVPIPYDYPRGRMIRSFDAGHTWDETEIGPLLFAEFGDPPLAPSEYVAPIKNWTVQELQQQNYWISSCVRVATTEPCMLKCLRAREEPKARQTFIIRRGMKVFCYKDTHYPVLEIYNQKESGESMYHTFYILGLSPGKKYWLAFTADANLEQTRSVSSYFTLTHPKGAPPMVITRRPAAPGTYCTIGNQVGEPCPNHYLNLDETIPDEDATYIFNYMPWTCWAWDTYRIAPIIQEEQPIIGVEVTARLAFQGGNSYASGAMIMIRTHGHNYYSNVFSYLGTTYQDRSYLWILNPFTHLDWTPEEINEMEIGIAVYCYWGVGWATVTKCTQLYATISHGCGAYC